MDTWCHLGSSCFFIIFTNSEPRFCMLGVIDIAEVFCQLFSQYFGKTNMLSIKDTQLRGMSWRFFRIFKTSGVQDFGSCRF